MNHYGSRAMAHWQRWLPNRYAQIPAPQTFFTDLGQQVADQVAELSTQLAGDDPPDETYMDKVGRLNTARMQAEETVLRELVLLTPEPGADPDETETSTESSTDPDPGSDWIPLTEDPQHPYWARVREQETDEELTR